MRLASDVIGNQRPAEIKRISTEGAREGGEPAEALYAGGGWCTQREGESGKGAATEAPAALSTGNGGLKPGGPQNTKGRMLQTTLRVKGIARCTQQHERGGSPKEGAAAGPRETMGHLPKHFQVPGTEDWLAGTEAKKPHTGGVMRRPHRALTVGPGKQPSSPPHLYFFLFHSFFVSPFCRGYGDVMSKSQELSLLASEGPQLREVNAAEGHQHCSFLPLLFLFVLVLRFPWFEVSPRG